MASSRSRLPEIFDSYQKSLQKIDAIERQLEEKVTEKRHRAINLLDEIPSYRKSTLRLYISHHCDLETVEVPISPPVPATPVANENANAITNANANANVEGTDTSPAAVPNEIKTKEVKKNKWNIEIEGRLLIGHKDHEAAELLEKSAKVLAKKEGRSYVTQSDVTSDANMTSRERAATRFMHDREGEDPVLPIKFAHFFDRVSVSFQTYQKKSELKNAASFTPGKPRSKRGTNPSRKQAPTPPVRKENYTTNGVVSSLFWNRQRNNPSNPSSVQNALDTNAYHAIYNDDLEPEGYENKIIATIRLHRRWQEQRYRPSNAFCIALLPSFLPKKQLPTAMTNHPTNGVQAPPPPPPVSNDINVPSLMTIDDGLQFFHHYIKKNNLLDANDLSTVNNNPVLEELFGCKTMNVSSIQSLFLSRKLMVPSILGTAEDCPIVLTYVMKKENATNSKNRTDGKDADSGSSTDMMGESSPKRRRMSTSPVPQEDVEEPTANLLSCDIDIDVPHLYHGRTRDILRRIKIREYEYTSCRTKALRTVEYSRANEDIIKERLENIVKGKALTSNHLPVLAALAKAAPDSEARKAAHFDAKTTLLVDRLVEHSQKAKSCWDIIDNCLSMQNK